MISDGSGKAVDRASRRFPRRRLSRRFFSKDEGWKLISMAVSKFVVTGPSLGAN